MSKIKGRLSFSGKIKGTKVGEDRVQMAIVFDEKTFKRIARLADDSDVSFAEAVRILVSKALSPNLKRVA